MPVSYTHLLAVVVPDGAAAVLEQCVLDVLLPVQTGGFLRVVNKPVSYTHLDVYKRQVHQGAAGGRIRPAERRMGAEQLSAAISLFGVGVHNRCV